MKAAGESTVGRGSLFWTRPDPTHTNSDQTRPNPRVDPTRVHQWVRVEPAISWWQVPSCRCYPVRCLCYINDTSRSLKVTYYQRSVSDSWLSCFCFGVTTQIDPLYATKIRAENDFRSFVNSDLDLWPWSWPFDLLISYSKSPELLTMACCCESQRESRQKISTSRGGWELEGGGKSGGLLGTGVKRDQRPVGGAVYGEWCTLYTGGMRSESAILVVFVKTKDTTAVLFQSVNPLTPTVAIWVQLLIILC